MSSQKMGRNKSIALLIAVLALFAGATIGLVGSTFTTPMQMPVRDFQSSVRIGRSAGKTLVILLDSVPGRLLFSRYTPFLSSYRYQGAWGTTRVASLPLTIACTHSIFSGVAANPLHPSDFNAAPTAFDSFPARVRRSGRIFATCSPTLHTLYAAAAGLAPLQMQNLPFSEHRRSAERMFEKSREMLSSRPWDAAATAFYEADYAGHLYTPRSREYLSILRVIDDRVRQLVALTGPKDTVLITSEHGMNAEGFHVGTSPDVMETGFILTGPGVKKTGPETVLETDWAPTLSILSGVSPFYTQIALPAFKILDLPKDTADGLIREYSQWLDPASRDFNLEELEHQRMLKLSGQVSPILRLGVVLAMLLSVVALLYMALPPVFAHAGFRSGLKLLARMAWYGTALTSFLVLATRRFECPPFSANFMMSHFLPVSAFFALLAGMAAYFRNIFVRAEVIPRETAMLLFITAVMTAIFASTGDAYHPLNWALASIPVVGWGASRRKEWLIILGSLLLGLVIRRLTVFRAYGHNVQLPPRWMIACALLAAAQLYMFWNMRRDHRIKEIILAGTACFALGIAIIACPAGLLVKAALLIAWLAAVARLSSAYPAARYIWWGLWTAFFYMGTSGSLENTTLAVSLGVMPAVWLLLEKESAAAKGIAAALVLWLFYVLPGNGFALNIQDLRDRLIMGSSVSGRLEYSIALIAARNIIPAALLLWGLCSDRSSELVSSVSSAALPAVCGVLVLTVQMTLVPHSGFLWSETVTTAILLGHLVILASASAVVGLGRLAASHAHIGKT